MKIQHWRLGSLHKFVFKAAGHSVDEDMIEPKVWWLNIPTAEDDDALREAVV